MEEDEGGGGGGGGDDCFLVEDAITGGSYVCMYRLMLELRSASNETSRAHFDKCFYSLTRSEKVRKSLSYISTKVDW